MRKLHSLSGVVPIGAFLLLHIWVTLSIVGSSEAYDRQIAFVHGGPLLGFLEVVLVLIPLGYHALYGIARTFEARDPNHAHDSMLTVTLMRLSGIVILVFVAVHTWEFRVETWTKGLPVSVYSTTLIAHLSSTQSGIPLVAFGYLLGLAASFFHLVNGMSSFCTTWGYTKSDEAKRRARTLFRVGGGILFGVSALMVVQIATGARYFPSERPETSATACGTAVPTIAAPSAATAPSALPARDH